MNQIEENLIIVNRFFDEVWNHGNASTIDELFVVDELTEGLGEEFRNGPERFKQFHSLVISTCQDIHMNIIHMMGSNDMVSVYANMKCTHKASGKKLCFAGGGFIRLLDGKIVQGWNAWNFLDLLQQLGAVPENILPSALLNTENIVTP